MSEPMPLRATNEPYSNDAWCDVCGQYIWVQPAQDNRHRVVDCLRYLAAMIAEIGGDDE